MSLVAPARSLDEHAVDVAAVLRHLTLAQASHCERGAFAGAEAQISGRLAHRLWPSSQIPIAWVAQQPHTHTENPVNAQDWVP